MVWKRLVICFILHWPCIYLFVVRPDTMIVQEVKRDFPLEDWIEQLRQGLYGYYTAAKAVQTDTLREKSLNQYLQYGQQLYQKLVAPVHHFHCLSASTTVA